MNNITLLGRLTADPELKYLQSGQAVVNFTLADNTGKDEASFFDCAAFGENATNIANSCKKGHRLLVVGRMKQRKWQAQDGTTRTAWDLNVSMFQYIEAKENNAAPAQQPAAPSPYPAGAVPPYGTPPAAPAPYPPQAPNAYQYPPRQAPYGAPAPYPPAQGTPPATPWG